MGLRAVCGALTEVDEHASHIVRRFGGGLKVGHVILARVGLPLLLRHEPVLVEVALVGCKRDHHVGLAVQLQLTHPTLRTLERLEGRDVVRHDGGLRAAVVLRVRANAPRSGWVLLRGARIGRGEERRALTIGASALYRSEPAVSQIPNWIFSSESSMGTGH